MPWNNINIYLPKIMDSINRINFEFHLLNQMFPKFNLKKIDSWHLKVNLW